MDIEEINLLAMRTQDVPALVADVLNRLRPIDVAAAAA